MNPGDNHPAGRKRHPDRPLLVAGIGASAGGLAALQGFFDALDPETGVAFVIITHMDPERESFLPELLQAHTAMPVQQVTEAVPLEPNHVYVISPNRHLIITETHLSTEPLSETRDRRMPIDHFFRSLAAAHGEAVALIFSGGGADGTVGAKMVKGRGGLVLVQDPAEAEFDSMPRAAIASGVADVVAPVAGLARQLVNFAGYVAHLYLPDSPDALTADERGTLHAILGQVHARTGHDFGHYRQATILRRVRRRVQLHGLDSLAAYGDFLRTSSEEASALFQDMLIGVTNFFRDAEAWDALAAHVIPRLFAHAQEREGDDAREVRVWSVGCSTGEEAYTLAMLLLEHAAKLGLEGDVPPRPIQVFATDLDDNALAFGRAGLYPDAIEADLSSIRLHRFFTREGIYYRVRREVRELVLFTAHNVLRDPPFSNIDLISSRNLLIYLQTPLQEKVFEIYHYALRPQGVLFLGSAETPPVAGALFEPIIKENHIYLATEQAGERKTIPSLPLSPIDGPWPGPWLPSTRTPTRHELHLELLEAQAPPSILIDADHNIVHLSQRAGRYLQHPGGTPTDNIVRLVRPELQMELRAALHEAFSQGRATVGGPVVVDVNGGYRVYVAVRPTRPERASGPARALVMFIEDESEQPAGTAAERADSASEGRVEQLEYQLAETRERLQRVVQEYETANEELRATNEELQSINEEYRSTAEELETSQEELQSLNEELVNVNSELQNKVAEISDAHSDLQNLIQATEIPTLFLDRELSINWYTPSISALFNLRPVDRGRPIAELAHHLQDADLVADAQQVLDTLVPLKREVQGEGGKWYHVHTRPYRTLADQIRGVILTFVDVTDAKGAELELRRLASSLEKRVEKRTIQIRRMAADLTRAEQRERDRIATVLHDDFQQFLYALKFQLLAIEQELVDEPGKALRAELSEAQDLLRQLIDLTRSLSVDLSPPALQRGSMETVLAWLAEQMEEQFGLHVQIEAEEPYPVADRSLRVLLLQVVRELLFNVVKHAQVASATVSLVARDGQLAGAVRDRGVGYDAQPAGDGGWGLATIRQRLELAGGTLRISKHSGGGTDAMFTIPIPDEAAAT